MKSIVFLLICLLSIPHFGAAQSGSEKNLLALHERKFSWMMNGQLDSLNDILDDDITYVHSNGWTQNKTEVIADFKSKKLVMNSAEITGATARIYNNKTGIVNGTVLIKGTKDNVPFETKVLYTEVYVQRHRQWFLSARHACKI